MWIHGALCVIRILLICSSRRISLRMNLTLSCMPSVNFVILAALLAVRVPQKCVTFGVFWLTVDKSVVLSAVLAVR